MLRDKPKRIHFLGVGGVGMAGLAVLLKGEGHVVTGCDLHPSPRTRWLESLGIAVAIGHDPSHVRDADCVIVAVAHSAFRELPMDTIRGMFRPGPDEEKVLIDVKGLFSIEALRASGLKWWRL